MPSTPIFNATAADAALKVLYSDQRMTNLVYRNNPLLAMIGKNENFTGKNLPQPVNYSPGAGGSADFTTTLAQQQAPTPKEFIITRTKGYSIAELDYETMLSSQNDMGAFLEFASFMIDMKVQEQSNFLAYSVFGDGIGTIGRVQGISTGVITLTNPEDAVFFEVNQALVAYDTTNTTARNSGNPFFVIAVDRDAGTVTVETSRNGGAASPSGVIATDILITAGNRNSTLKGLQAWIPSTAPTSGDSFFGVDRSIDTTKLAGVRFDGSGMSIEEAAIKAAAKVGREGGMPRWGFVNFETYAALVNSLGSKVQYDSFRVGEIGFEGIKIHGAGTTITVYADRSCPADRMFLLTPESWKLRTLGKAPRILSQDGLTWLRESDSDSATVRVGWYGQLVCNAPAHNANVTLSV